MNHRLRVGALVGGAIGDHFAEGEFAATSPVSGDEIAVLPTASLRTIDAAVGAARVAHDVGVWRRMSWRDRGIRMRRLASLIEAAAPELARLEAMDTGKAVAYTRANDIQIAIEALDYQSTQFRGESQVASHTLAAGFVHHEIVQPIGVVAEILPWNGPIWTGVQRLAAILAAGATTVIKPSELGSVTFGRIAELIVESDIPAGVVNVVFGSGNDVGAPLVIHPGVDAVSFTGGTTTGGRILRALSTDIKPVTLELGGKNALIVMSDADVEAAATWARIGGFANAGQVCVASSRVLVADAVYDQFLASLSRQMREIIVGNPLDEAVQMGSLVATSHADSVRAAIAHGREAGEVLAAPVPDDVDINAAFVAPTLITDLPEDDRLLRDEIFGPVVTVERFSDDADAVRRANRTAYGLAAGIFTSDATRGWEVAAALRAGEIYVNRWFSPGVLEYPVSGDRQSGFGRSGVDAYLRRTAVFFERGEDLATASSTSV